MDDSFFAYLHRLELIAFFSGYPLIYATVLLIAGSWRKNNETKKSFTSSLSYSYALVGTLYLGLELRNMYPDYSIDNFKQFSQQPFLIAWGILAVLFWIPALAKKPVLSLLHSIVFFILLIEDLFFQAPAADRSLTSNDMKFYTISLLLNSISYIAIALICFLLKWFKDFRKSYRYLQ